MLHDPSYRTNAQLLSRKLSHSPFSAKEKLIKWVEFAAEFPDFNELNLPTDEEMSLFVYYSLDAIFFSLALLTVFFLLCAFLFRKTFSISKSLFVKIALPSRNLLDQFQIASKKNR